MRFFRCLGKPKYDSVIDTMIDFGCHAAVFQLNMDTWLAENHLKTNRGIRAASEC